LTCKCGTRSKLRNECFPRVSLYDFPLYTYALGRRTFAFGRSLITYWDGIDAPHKLANETMNTLSRYVTRSMNGSSCGSSNDAVYGAVHHFFFSCSRWFFLQAHFLQEVYMQDGKWQDGIVGGDFLTSRHSTAHFIVLNE